MNVQLDLILPPIVVGILLLLVLNLNTLMMESQVDNRLQTDMQVFANSAVDVLQERTREIIQVTAINDSTLSYISLSCDTINVRRQQRDLLFLRKVGASYDTLRVPARLSDIRFTIKNAHNGQLLNIRVESRSLVDEEMGNSPYRQRAFAEREILLRSDVTSGAIDSICGAS